MLGLGSAVNGRACWWRDVPFEAAFLQARASVRHLPLEAADRPVIEQTDDKLMDNLTVNQLSLHGAQPRFQTVQQNVSKAGRAE
eukprot:763053-Hanusia_phi.AAC.6